MGMVICLYKHISLLSAYYLATQRYKCMRLTTGFYGITVYQTIFLTVVLPSFALQKQTGTRLRLSTEVIKSGLI